MNFAVFGGSDSLTATQIDVAIHKFYFNRCIKFFAETTNRFTKWHNNLDICLELNFVINDLNFLEAQ